MVQLAGFDLGCIERNSQCGDKALLCLELEVYSKDDSFCYEPINLCFPGVTVKFDCLGLMTSEWVLQKVMGVCHQVGLSCEGFEGELMALFTTIEACRHQRELASNSKSVNRGKRELKRLVSSIYYDSRGGSSSRGRANGRAVSVIYEAYYFLECEGVERGK